MKQLFFVFLMSFSCFAQLSKTHYIPPITASIDIKNPSFVQDLYLYISTPNTNKVPFKIIQNGGPTISGVVSNATPYIHFIPKNINNPYYTPPKKIGKLSNKGFIIEAEDLVYVSARYDQDKLTETKKRSGCFVSKGNSALGKTFRLGAMLNPANPEETLLLNFASIMATENNTKVSLSNFPLGSVFTDGTTYNGPIEITLQRNECYIVALEYIEGLNSPPNSSNLIGALVESDKPIAVISGSNCGSNSDKFFIDTQIIGYDSGFDQIVSFEKTGREYIFVKGIGTNELERVLLITHKPNTVIYLNDTTTPYTTLYNPGDYVVLDGNQYRNGNLYVKSTENVFAYQSIGGLAEPPNPSIIEYDFPQMNQHFFFVPPLNCATPNSVDNIPYINYIGKSDYNAKVNIVTETGAEVKINGILTTENPVSIKGNSGFERYTINSLGGNITINSTKQAYVSGFGISANTTFGGYYSGFDLKPEIGIDRINTTKFACISNVVLKLNSASAYDSFQWYFNDLPIDPIQYPDAITKTFTPNKPGYYQVRVGISTCPSNNFIFSDKITVSECLTDLDGDTVFDNIDIDNDQDGILNCTESYGNTDIDLSNSAAGNIIKNTYSNSFTGLILNSGTGLPLGTFTGAADGSFITEIPPGKANTETGTEASGVTYKMTFTKPISVGIEYVTAATADTSVLMNADAEYIINSDINQTITVLNPDNQLVIDTNCDGIYESGVTEYSSFEIRFRLNSSTSLAAGTGTFKFLSYLAKSISITHKNLSNTQFNKSTFKLFANCIPKDSDADGIPDQLDPDSDNDGIKDNIEAHVNAAVAISNKDTNKNGLDNAFEPGLATVDSDLDGIVDYLDLDSDNDGILDSVETGNDLDADGIRNYRDLDSDGDLCKDVIEAGFTDSDGDGQIESSPLTVDVNGRVIGATYSVPLPNYLLSVPIVLTTQPKANPTCEFQNTTITFEDNGGNTYQWQLSTDGINWTDLTNDATYSDVTSKTLTILNVSIIMNGYQYRVLLNKVDNSCGLISGATTLTVNTLPIVNDTTIIQCDDDLDLKTLFNLTIKNNSISATSVNETFSYYKTDIGAKQADVNQLISNYTTFPNTTSPMNVWARVANNSTNCFSVAKLTLVAATTKIAAGYNFIEPPVCDDAAAADGTVSGDPEINSRDGITAFNLTNAIKSVESQLPGALSNYTFKYYRNKADALTQNDLNGNSLAIKSTEYTNFRNDIPFAQNIWVRVNNNFTTDCGDGFGDYIKLSVGKLPDIDLNTDHTDDHLVCQNDPNFSIQLDAGIEDSSPPSNYNYVWTKDGNILVGKTDYSLEVNAEGLYSVEVINKTTGCSSIRTINVIASSVALIDFITIIDLAEINTVTVNVTKSSLGDYEYSLDEPAGPFQDSNIFTNIPAGVHDIYIHDKNGCRPDTKTTISIVGVPKFFTPNGDGYNDYWNVKGVNATFYSKSIIYIFDRFGKLLKQWVPSANEGWDGTFNGAPMIADDYWYIIKLEDGREAKGHFSLKR